MIDKDIKNKLKMLLGPYQLGSLKLRNRVIMGPMWSRYAAASGEVSQEQIDYFTARAKYRPALIIVESAAVDGRHTWVQGQIRIDNDKFLNRLYDLVYAVHLNDVRIFIQLHCAGAFGTDPISPSGVATYGQGREEHVQPRAITMEEAEEIRDMFIKAAVRAKEVGFDGVELHGGTGYFLQQWVSPHSNRRADRYGGSFENRISLPLEIVLGIRQKCGREYPLGYALCADELLPDGITMDESKAFMKALEREEVDYINIATGVYETFHLPGRSGVCLRQPRGLTHITREFKKIATTIKVHARSSGEHDPFKWEEALEKGEADVITIARQFLCDPEFPKKLYEGRLDEVRRCILCYYCGLTASIGKGSLICVVNPELGRERKYAIQRTASPKKVLVVGGGPGGLEAARVAALRGHEVTLMEKEVELGGNVRTATLVLGKEHFKYFVIGWEERQCRKAGVKIELGKEVTLQVVKQLKPDVLIIATGSTPHIPEISGVNKPHVVTAADVLGGRAKIGKRVAMVGGNQVGIETADFIVEKGLAESVTVIEMLPEIAQDMDGMNKLYMFTNLLPNYDVRLHTNMKVEEITDEGVKAIDNKWKRHTFEADTVVLAAGYTPNIALYEQLKDEVPEVYCIGDCVKPRLIFNAIHEGAYIARQI